MRSYHFDQRLRLKINHLKDIYVLRLQPVTRHILLVLKIVIAKKNPTKFYNYKQKKILLKLIKQALTPIQLRSSCVNEIR